MTLLTHVGDVQSCMHVLGNILSRGNMVVNAEFAEHFKVLIEMYK